jgi:hypothetical protein
MSMFIIIKYSLKAAFIYFFNSIMANCEMEIERTEYNETETNDHSKLAKIGLKSHMPEGREP